MNGVPSGPASPQSATPGVRARVVNSRLRVGCFASPGDAVTLTQHDSTTCGAACVLAARLLRGQVPQAVQRAGGAEMPGRALLAELAQEQRRVQRAMNRRGLGPLPWPSALGSTPWAVARAMSEDVREAATSYQVHAVRDRGGTWAEDVAQMRDRLGAGEYIVGLTGGPLDRPRPGDRGVTRRLRSALAAAPAVPRHYVLALPPAAVGRRDPGPGRALIFEPSSGTVRVHDLLAPRDPHGAGPRELGFWPRVLAVLVPR